MYFNLYQTRVILSATSFTKINSLQIEHCYVYVKLDRKKFFDNEFQECYPTV